MKTGPRNVCRTEANLLRKALHTKVPDKEECCNWNSREISLLRVLYLGSSWRLSACHRSRSLASWSCTTIKSLHRRAPCSPPPNMHEQLFARLPLYFFDTKLTNNTLNNVFLVLLQCYSSNCCVCVCVPEHVVLVYGSEIFHRFFNVATETATMLLHKLKGAVSSQLAIV